WVISVNFKNWNGPISIFESYSELVAQKKLQYWAKRFGTKPIDLTSIAGEKNDSNKPKPIIQESRPTATAAVAIPPGIEVSYSAGVTAITLPRRKANFGPVLELVFTAGFCSGFAYISFMFIFSDPSHRSKSTPEWMFNFIGILFFAVAVYAFFAIMKKTWSREVITLDSTGVVRGTKIFGRVWNEVRVHRQEIKDISRRKYSGATRDIEMVTITGERNLIRAGQTLQPDQLEWLCKELCDKFKVKSKP
ncbi:MAG TPA: hypothetical protein VK654_02660, partial [Nitrospirota bacterium]|nr:hypothetical protein [Nitrospirota bacterium]